MKKVLSVGMMVCDVLISPVPFDILQRDSASIGIPVTSCGGDALNVAMGLAKLGVPVAVSGRIGNDANGRYIRKACTDVGIGISGLVLDLDCPTACSYALIDPNGERHFLSNRQIFHRLCYEDIPDSLVQQADIVYMGSAMAMEKMNRGALEKLFRRAKELGKLTVMDGAITEAQPQGTWLEYLRPTLKYTDVFFPSREEASEIAGSSEPGQIAWAFRDSGLKVLGVKLGAEGCFVTDFSKARSISAVPGITVVDSCGAGDSFMAGFLAAAARGWDPFRAAEFAGCVAAKNVQAVGGTAGIPSFDNAMAFYHKIYPMNSKEMR